LKEPPNSNPVYNSKNTRHSEATIVTVQPHKVVFSVEEKASSYLSKPQWVYQVLQSLDPDSKHSPALDSIDSSLLEKADLLQRKLEQQHAISL
jgi:hypothetical protein